MRDTQATAAAAPITPTTQTVVSLLLIIHLFFAGVAFSSNLAPIYSRLQNRLLTNFAVYTQLLGFDLNFLPFYWTHATIDDVDHRVEILPRGKIAERDADWIVLSAVATRGTERFQRYQRLGRVWSLVSPQDELTAALAKAVGTSFIEQRAIQPVRVRCRRHTLQDWDLVRGGTAAQRDPHDPSYFQSSYDANLVVSRNGTVSVVKLAETSEIAVPSPRDSTPDANNR
jgi:hypothetical protein